MAKKKTVQTNTGGLTIRQRGCGWPIGGGSYLYIDTTEAPIWTFVVDPAYILIDPASMGLPSSDSAIAMVLKERLDLNGNVALDKDGNPIYDLYDWIGSKAYPNPLDWLLEVQALGFHQKVNPDHLLWLSPESMYFPIHANAGIKDPTNVYHYHEHHKVWDEKHIQKCPKPLDVHMHVDITEADLSHLGTCPGLYYNDVIKGQKQGNYSKDKPVVVREMPSFSWEGFEALSNVEHVPAIFARFPIGKIAEVLVYEDQNNHSEEDVLKELEQMDARLQRIKKIPWSG